MNLYYRAICENRALHTLQFAVGTGTGHGTLRCHDCVRLLRAEGAISVECLDGDICFCLSGATAQRVLKPLLVLYGLRGNIRIGTVGGHTSFWLSA